MPVALGSSVDRSLSWTGPARRGLLGRAFPDRYSSRRSRR